MSHSNAVKVASIIDRAGGRIVGRTRLQKVAYLLYIAGCEESFRFSYRRFGPFSEELALAARDAHLHGLIQEVEHPATWGGVYSEYQSSHRNEETNAFAAAAAASDAVALELAATAAFLKIEGFPDPWAETERRKPEKAADNRIDQAKELYRRLSQMPTPKRLPVI